MGRVTDREATVATDLARDVEGVEKVVRVLEIISPDQVPGNGKTKL
jgi:osmotically-inducible protein OsmY